MLQRPHLGSKRVAGVLETYCTWYKAECDKASSTMMAKTIHATREEHPELILLRPLARWQDRVQDVLNA